MTNELALVSDELASQHERRAALARLNTAAEEAATPEEAQRIMQQGRVIAEALAAARQPFEDCWLAGKASVLAARRLGTLLLAVDGRGPRVPGSRNGWLPSERSILRDELGLATTTSAQLVRLARVPDPEFQRYIQGRDRIPSLYGALTTLRVKQPDKSSSTWQLKRRRNLGVKAPPNPSLDEACSLIVRALGHLGSKRLNGRSQDYCLARSSAMDMLYQAHDLLRPFAGGYVK